MLNRLMTIVIVIFLVGLWTRADAVTDFDDLTVRSISAGAE